ncbi:hypothetical protein ACP4OV_021310 [Aristida adscensionis]
MWVSGAAEDSPEKKRLTHGRGAKAWTRGFAAAGDGVVGGREQQARDSRSTKRKLAAGSSSMEAVQRHELVPELQFPPGFHFVPTEYELVDVYLRRKIERLELPLNVINEVDILDWQPGQLVEAYKRYGERKWYFFTRREPSQSNKENEPSRKVRVPGGAATWKATGSVIEIRRKGKDGKPLGGGEVVGTKRVLIYHSTDPEEDGKWSMHEYLLKEHAKIQNYTLCSIQRKQNSDTVRSPSKDNTEAHPEEAQPAGNKKKRKTKASSQRPEAAQLADNKATKKKRTTKKASQQQEEEVSLGAAIPQPFTQPVQDHQVLPEHEQPIAEYDGEGLPAVPLQGCPYPYPYPYPYPDELHEAHAASFLHRGDMDAQTLLQWDAMTFYNQGQQQPPLASIDSSVSPCSNGEDGQYLQEHYYGGFGAPDQFLCAGRFLGQDANNNLVAGDSNSSSMGHGGRGPYDQCEPCHYQQQDISAGYFDQSYEQKGSGSGSGSGGGMFGQQEAGFHGAADQLITKTSSAENDDAVVSKVLCGDDLVADCVDYGMVATGDFVGSFMCYDDPTQGMAGAQPGINQHDLQSS